MGRVPMLICAMHIVCLIYTVHASRYGHNGLIDDSPQARMLFQLSDKDNNTSLTHTELHTVFLEFDKDGDGNVTSGEFLNKWTLDNFGPVEQGLQLFLNLDVNRDVIIDELHDVPYVFKFFDRNVDDVISEGEFVIQWVKISL